MRLADLVQGRVAKGTELILEGRITELLPLFSMGGEPYERFILDDGSARITVIMPLSEMLFLPGDRVRLTARVRPCPYTPTVNCLETEAEEVEILDWKWIDLSHRRSEALKGPFNIKVLLHMTRMDEEVIEGIVSTDLDPLRMKEVFEERIEAGKSVRDLLYTLTAMTMYSVFLRDLSAASMTRIALSLLESLQLPEDFKLALGLLSDMLNTLASREGLAPYISPPEDMRGVIERYPVASERELDELPKLGGLARKIVSELNEGQKVSVLLEFSEPGELQEIRKMAEVVAGLSGSKLLIVNARSLVEEREIVISDLKQILGSKQEKKVIAYMEAPELLFPSESMLDLLGIPQEEKQDLLRTKEEATKSLRELLGGVCVIAATVSGAMVDPQALGRASVVSMKAGEIVKGIPDYTM